MNTIEIITFVYAIVLSATFCFATILTFYFYVAKQYTDISFIFEWYDIWVGGFYDTKKDIYYWFPLPMIGFVFKKGTPND